MKTAKPWKAEKPMVSSFVSGLKEDDTPTFSKNTSPNLHLQPISPVSTGPPLSTQRETQQQSNICYRGCVSNEPDQSKSPCATTARFSSQTAQPIQMTTPLTKTTPTSLSSRIRTHDSNSKKKFLDSVCLQEQEEDAEGGKQQFPQQGYTPACKGEKIPMPLHLFDVIPIIPYDRSDFWRTFLLRLISDVLITGTHWNLFRKILFIMEQLSSSASGQQSMPLYRGVTIDKSKESEPFSNRLALTDFISSCRDSLSCSATSRAVKGIPNYGQTCFLNAVLQALASLDSFLLYLGKINQVHKDSCFGLRRIGAMSQASVLHSRASHANMGQPSTNSFSQELMEILLAVNGLNSRSNSSTSGPSYIRRDTPEVDPRHLLVRVAEKNAQFKTHDQNLGEQQDAQELLQALLGMVIEEVQFDSTAFMSDSIHFADEEIYNCHNENEEALTAAIAFSKEECNKYDSPEFIESSSIEVNGGNTSNDLSFSVLPEHVYKGKKTQIKHYELPKGLVGEKSKYAENSGKPDGVCILPCRTNLPEEKKQEDFDIAVTLARDAETTMAVEDSQPSHSVPRCCKERSDALKPEKIASANIPTNKWMHQPSKYPAKCAISSTTPSPLSGWLGSTLQCCKCKHIRPIQNSSFFDVPLVPTSVPAYLARGQRVHTRNQSPCSAQQQPCSIQQCLSDFTSVERVQDVECRFCTIQTQIAELEDEEMLLCAAIESISKRPQNGKGDTETLRTDLQHVQKRLQKFKSADLDLEDDLLVSRIDTNFAIEGDPCSTALSLERWEARKCLFFTRCPSILCCHIQRRYYDPYTNRMEKCAQFVTFDEILDFSPYCAYSPCAPTAWVSGSFESRAPLKRKMEFKILYRLQSIIEHKGNAHGGHYVSYRRLGSSWYHISDNHVSQVNWSQVQECQAYMLFYEAV